MRRTASVAIPLGCIIASLAAVAACEDDPSPQAADFDAQAPSFDANRPPPGDSSIPDQNAPADAGDGAVTVNVRTRQGQPIAGATVVFGAANGDVLQTVTSDATGTASAIVPSGSQVTVVLGTPDAPSLVTITAVAPGDVILASDLAPPSSPLAPSVELASEPAGAPGGTYYYRVASGGCASDAFAGSTNVPFLSYGVFAECIGSGGKFPVLVRALDDSFTETSFQFAKGNVAPTDGGVVTPAFGAWSTAITSQTVTGTNVVFDGGSSTLVAYGEIADGVMKPDYNYVGDEDGGVQATFKGHTGYAEAVQYEVAAHVYLGATNAVVGTATRAAAPTADGTTNIDFAGRLPEITSAGVDAGTPKRPAIGWTPVASLAAADGTYVVVSWFDSADGGEVSGTWSFVTPAGTTSVVAPALPATVASAPSASADFTYGGVPRVVVVDASFINGYADFRKAAGVLAPPRAIIDNQSTMKVPPLPVNGTVKFSAFTRNGD